MQACIDMSDAAGVVLCCRHWFEHIGHPNTSSKVDAMHHVYLKYSYICATQIHTHTLCKMSLRNGSHTAPPTWHMESTSRMLPANRTEICSTFTCTRAHTKSTTSTNTQHAIQPTNQPGSMFIDCEMSVNRANFSKLYVG